MIAIALVLLTPFIFTNDKCDIYFNSHTDETNLIIDTLYIHISDDISLQLVRKPFYEDMYDITYCDNGLICLIDSLPFWGTDGVAPLHVLLSATLYAGNHTIELDTSLMYNPWFASSTNDDFCLSCNSDMSSCSIIGRFSDASGSYIAMWETRGSISIRTMISNDYDIHIVMTACMIKK